MSKDTKKEKKNDQNANFVKDVKTELKKVTWPTGKQLVASTSTVLLLTLVIGVIVFVLDFAFENVNNYGIDKLRSTIVSSQTATENNEESNEASTETPSESEAPVETTETGTEENATSTTEGTAVEGQTTETTNQ